jgi:phospholipid/cholesterol/gamma-HCH transport system permease protein
MTIFSDIGRYLLMLKGMISRPENGKMYWKEFMHQCSEIGIGALGIVLIISVFIGAVSTVQTAYQLLTPLIPRSTIATIVRDTVILEFAPTLTCIVLAGVIGSKIASELGNMRVSEQIDALFGHAEDISRVADDTLFDHTCHGARHLGWKVGGYQRQYYFRRHL